MTEAMNELRERRRLSIKNNVSSMEFSAANTVSNKVLEQLFLELQTEADNCISDCEKLSQIPAVSRSGTNSVPDFELITWLFAELIISKSILITSHLYTK